MNTQQPQITPKDIVSIIKRRKTALLIPFIVLFVISLIVAFALPAHFRSSATILIEEQEIPQSFVMATVTSYAEQRFEMIKQRIMSYSNLLSLINTYGLYEDLKNKWSTEEIVTKMREEIIVDTISAEVMDRRTGRPTAVTIAFTLSYTGKNPSKVHKVTNALSTLFLEENLKVRTRQTEETTQFLEEEMNKVKESIKELNIKISQFKGDNLQKLPEFLNINIQLMKSTENKIALLNEQLKTLNEREKYFVTQLSLMSPEVEFNSDQKRLEELKIHLVGLKTEFSDQYPDVTKTEAEIKKLEEAIEAGRDHQKSDNDNPGNPHYINTKAELSGLRAEIRSVIRQIKEAIQKKEHYESLIGESAIIEGEYNSLLSEQANLKNKLNDLSAKLMEANVAYGLEKDQKGEKFTLIDPARLPEKPFKPNRLAIVLIGLVLSIGSSIGLTATLEFMSDAIYKTETLTRTTGIPVLGEIPAIKNEADISRLRQRQIVIFVSLVTVPVAGTLVFHFFIMDLYVFWAKLMRKLVM